jgi:hypothetical protein
VCCSKQKDFDSAHILDICAFAAFSIFVVNTKLSPWHTGRNFRRRSVKRSDFNDFQQSI